MAVGAAAALVVLSTATAFARESARTTVVWAHGALAYVSPRDSGSVEPGDLVVFTLRGDTLARGGVTRVEPGGLATATITWGSLDGAKHLERVDVLVRRGAVPPPPSLAVGCPSPGRANALLPCGSRAIPARLPDAGYVIGARFDASCQLERDSSPSGGSWPRTLELHGFDDADDEEIALERGEVDVALFWPGELSPHMRELPRWQGYRLGTRSRGVLAAIAVSPWAPSQSAPRTPTAADSAMLSMLDRGLFRGDLGPWDRASGALDASPPVTDAMPYVDVDEDPACSAMPAIRRYVDRLPGTRRPGPSIRLFYLDAPSRSPDSVALAVAAYVRAGTFRADLRSRADSLEREIRARPAAGPPAARDIMSALGGALGIVQLIPIRCSVLCRPELRPYVDALGADALADLMGRLVPGAEP